MTKHKQLLKRVPVYLLINNLPIQDRLASFRGRLFSPGKARRESAQAKVLMKALNALRIKPLTEESVKRYANEISTDFFWDCRSVGLFKDQKESRFKYRRTTLPFSLFSSLPEPLNRLKKLVPDAVFVTEDVEVNGTSIATLILTKYGNAEFYLHLLKEREECFYKTAYLSP